MRYTSRPSSNDRRSPRYTFSSINIGRIIHSQRAATQQKDVIRGQTTWSGPELRPLESQGRVRLKIDARFMAFDQIRNNCGSNRGKQYSVAIMSRGVIHAMNRGRT